jgi:predicted transcriptional regulator
MQAKNDASLGVAVAEIVKTFISHPDHGMKWDDIPGMIGDVVKAFQSASLTSSEAINATVQSKASAPVEQPAAETVHTVQEVSKPAKQPAPSRRKSREAAPASTAAAETVASAPLAAAPVEEEPLQEVKVVEEAQADIDPLEAKFGGKFPRTPWNNMDPMAAIKNDEIICLIDGLGRKMLHRHLKARHGMTPEEYRTWFDLPADYPMTAPGYSKEKSDYAKVVGLGTTAFTEKTKEPPQEAKATPKTSRRTRKETAGKKANARQRTTA